MPHYQEKRRNFESLLKEYEQGKFKIIFENSPIAILEQDASSLQELIKANKSIGRKTLEKRFKKNPTPLLRAFEAIQFLAVNRAALKLYRVRSAKNLRLNAQRILPRIPLETLIQEFLNLKDGQSLFELEFGIKRLNNKFIHVLMRVAVPKGMEKSLARIIVTFQDITERRRLEVKLQKQAQIDSLTKLLNHNSILEAVKTELDRARKYHLNVSFLLIDIDGFKQINDTHGHLKGDAVLVHVAAILRQALRKHDLIGRYGGDEFLVVLPETPMDNAQIAAERIHKLFKARQPIQNARVTFSIGISSHSNKKGQTNTVKSVIERADRGLYMAKDHGGNKNVISS